MFTFSFLYFLLSWMLALFKWILFYLPCGYMSVVVNVPDKGKEIKDLPPTEIVDLCQEAFIKTAEYLNGELEGISY